MAAKKSSNKKDTLLDKAVLLGSSLAYLTKGATDELIDTLEKNKVISTKQGKEVVEKMKADLRGRQKAAQSTVQKTVQKELAKVMDQLGLVTKKDLEALMKAQAKKSAPKKKSAKKTK